MYIWVFLGSMIMGINIILTEIHFTFTSNQMPIFVLCLLNQSPMPCAVLLYNHNPEVLFKAKTEHKRVKFNDSALFSTLRSATTVHAFYISIYRLCLCYFFNKPYFLYLFPYGQSTFSAISSTFLRWLETKPHWLEWPVQGSMKSIALQ